MAGPKWPKSNPWLVNDHNELAPLSPMIEFKCWRSKCCFCGQVSYLITSAKDLEELWQPMIELLAIKTNSCRQ